MGGPGRSGDQVAVHDRVGDGLVRVPPRGFRLLQIETHCGVSGPAPAAQDTRGRKNEQPVTDARDGLVLVVEVARDVQDPLVQADILRGSAAGNAIFGSTG